MFLIPILQAQTEIIKEVKEAKTERVSHDKILGRVLAEDLNADRDYPPFNRSAMDGYALKFNDFDTDLRTFKLVGEVMAGYTSTVDIKAGECIKIMTGAPVPLDADMVIKVELSSQSGNDITFDLNEAVKWRNIARQGEDITSDECLIPKNTQITPSIVSMMAVIGSSSALVYKNPTVSIISTGDEVKDIDASILPHQIRDSNSYALINLFKKYQIEVQNKFLVDDNKQALGDVISKGLNADILVLSGGVSMGDADFVPEILQKMGVEKVFHKVQIKPGKPIWFGRTKGGTVVFGLPGNPMSCQVGFKVFIEPYLRQYFKLAKETPLYLPLKFKHKSRSKFNEYFPAQIINHNGVTKLESNLYHTSGDISGMLNSDGLAVHSSAIEIQEENDVLAFYPW